MTDNFDLKEILFFPVPGELSDSYIKRKLEAIVGSDIFARKLYTPAFLGRLKSCEPSTYIAVVNGKDIRGRYSELHFVYQVTYPSTVNQEVH
jgi:hypothetical protein